MSGYQPFEKLTEKDVVQHIESHHNINLLEVPFRVALSRTARKCIFCRDFKSRTETKQVDEVERLYFRIQNLKNEYVTRFDALSIDERNELAHRLKGETDV